jgi:hypothetical protein
MRLGHYLCGAAAGLGIAAVAGYPIPLALATGAVAAAAAPLPDIDQRRWWAPLREFRPFQHRRLTHWWGLPASAVPLVVLTSGPVAWLLVSVITGWSSHLVGDWVFGRRGPRVTGWRGPGIPLAPWWGYHGVGLTCGGAVERFVAWPLLSLTLAAEVAIMIGV